MPAPGWLSMATLLAQDGRPGWPSLPDPGGSLLGRPLTRAAAAGPEGVPLPGGRGSIERMTEARDQGAAASIT